MRVPKDAIYAVEASPRLTANQASPKLTTEAPPNRRAPLSWSMRIGIALVCIYAGVAVLSFFWTPYDPLSPGIGDGYDPPSRLFLLGTDRLGSDMVSRLMAGARYDLGITVIRRQHRVDRWARQSGSSLAISVACFDTVVLRLVEVFQAFPGLLFAMLVVQAVGPGIINVILVLSFVGIPDYLRLARAEIHARRDWQYAEAARMVGNPPWRVAFRHLLPNSVGPLLAFTSINAAFVALVTASLGFLGLGLEPEHAGVGQHDRARPGRRDDRDNGGSRSFRVWRSSA